MSRQQWVAGVVYYLAVIPLLVCFITGCTTTPQGKSLDRANYADLGSTGLTLSLVEGATETNPLGLALLPMKLGMGWGLEQYTDNCYKRAGIIKWWNSLYYGAATNNLSILAGAAGMAAPAVGVVAGIGYFFLKDNIEPDTFACVPDVPALQNLAQAYSEGDTELLEGVFTPDAYEAEKGGVSMSGLSELKAGYGQLFAETEDRQIVFLNDEYLGARIGDLWWHYKYEIEYEGDLISSFTYEWVPLEEVQAL